MSHSMVFQGRAGNRRAFLFILALVAVLALGAGLRFYRLDGQSLWNDEGTSVALAGRSLAQITRDAAADIHPPLYHYLLHYWLGLFGTGEIAARSLSALLGVGLVGLIYLLGRRLFDPLTGWLAALLAALSSYQIYYAQEARMYMLLTFLGAASTCLFYLGWLDPREPRRRWAAGGWVAVTALAVYTHYLAATVVLAQNAAWVVGLGARLWRRQVDRGQMLREAATWFGAQAVVGALYLPWLWLTWDQLHRWPAVSQPFGLLDLLERALPLFALGPVVQAQPLRWLVLAVLILAGLGLAWPDRSGRQKTSARLLAALYWVAPVAILYYLARSRPVYHPKFLVLATPGFTLLVARGIARLAPSGQDRSRLLAAGRLAMAGGALLVALAASLPGLRNYYLDPHYARDDYRGIARYISTLGRPGDIVLINAPSQIETVAYYYRGPLPMVPIPLYRPPDREDTIRRLSELTRDKERIFGIFWATSESDPERIVEGWLDTHAYKAFDAWYGNVRLVLYAMPAKTLGAGIQHPLNASLGEQIRLAGYSLASDEVAAGEILQLSLFWQGTGKIERRYKVFTHVIDEAGRLVGQRDSEPGGGVRLTTGWQEGEQIVDRYGLPIRPGTPPGEYLIEVGMYGLEDGQRLPVTVDGKAGGDSSILQKVRVVRPQAPPPLAALDMQYPRLIQGDDVQLLGFSFGRLGALDQGPAPLSPGGAVECVLFWQALRAPQSDMQVLLRITDQASRVRLERSALPVEGRYPLQAWQPQEIVRDSWHLRLPDDLQPGRYRLFAGWQSGPGAPPAQLYPLFNFVVQ